MPAQTISIVVTVAVYGGLIAFILYRQMTAQPLRARRLVVLPLVIGFFAFQQLGRQHLSGGITTLGFLVLSLVVGALAGLWRGTTFRYWAAGGTVLVKGTRMTLVAWAVLIAVRLPFALAGHAADLPQGLEIGELLLSLAVTFAAQNAVIWMRVTGRAALAAAGP